MALRSADVSQRAGTGAGKHEVVTFLIGVGILCAASIAFAVVCVVCAAPAAVSVS